MQKESNPGRLRRETRTEESIGMAIAKAAEEADNRVARQNGAPAATEEELARIAASPHLPVLLFTRAWVKNIATGEEEAYRIVLPEEVDLEAGCISLSSPIGRALYQEYPGSVVKVRLPAGEALYRILQVES